MEGVYPDKLCGALQTHFHRWGRYGKRQLQRHFLRKRGAAGIPGHHFIKQKSHRFCISASTMASYWSGRRGSNSLPPPWQGGALPDELRPHIRCIYPCTLPFFNGAFAMNCVKKEKVLHDFRRGASDRNRTNDTGIFSPLLYRLSYRGIESAFIPALLRIRFLNRGPRKNLRMQGFVGKRRKSGVHHGGLARKTAR